MTRFSKLDATGRETDVRFVDQRDMLKCPHVIIAAEHYRADGSCRCNDPEHKEMKEWGYKWKDGRWQG